MVLWVCHRFKPHGFSLRGCLREAFETVTGLCSREQTGVTTRRQQRRSQLSARVKLLAVFVVGELLVLAGLALQLWTLRSSILTLYQQQAQRQINLVEMTFLKKTGELAFLCSSECDDHSEANEEGLSTALDKPAQGNGEEGRGTGVYRC